MAKICNSSQHQRSVIGGNGGGVKPNASAAVAIIKLAWLKEIETLFSWQKIGNGNSVAAYQRNINSGSVVAGGERRQHG